MSRRTRSLSLLCLLFAAGCGGASDDSSTLAAAGTPREGPPVDLMALVPANATVVLHADLNAVRQDPGRYERIAGELASELGLGPERAILRGLLDRTDESIGVFLPSSAEGQLEGMLLFTGRYSDADFARALGIATGRHGGPPDEGGEDGRRVLALGSASLVQLDTWTWAIVQGPTARAHLAQVPLRGSRAFTRGLLEFGPRIGLPRGATQAWANQDSTVGVDMVALVFQGENPQMVQNFVATVRRHLGL